MIICSCNVITDCDVRNLVHAESPQRTAELGLHRPMRPLCADHQADHGRGHDATPFVLPDLLTRFKIA